MDSHPISENIQAFPSDGKPVRAYSKERVERDQV